MCQVDFVAEAFSWTFVATAVLSGVMDSDSSSMPDVPSVIFKVGSRRQYSSIGRKIRKQAVRLEEHEHVVEEVKPY
jgi:hypothetical protein